MLVQHVQIGVAALITHAAKPVGTLETVLEPQPRNVLP
jgi:hypothetical protein